MSENVPPTVVSPGPNVPNFRLKPSPIYIYIRTLKVKMPGGYYTTVTFSHNFRNVSLSVTQPFSRYTNFPKKM